MKNSLNDLLLFLKTPVKVTDISGQEAEILPIHVEGYYSIDELVIPVDENNTREKLTVLALASGMAIKTRESLESFKQRIGFINKGE